MTVAAAWISNGWIYSDLPEQDARYWTDGKWIWGPAGAADANTGYWIESGWIWRANGARKAVTAFYIRDETIYGPAVKLPFCRDD